MGLYRIADARKAKGWSQQQLAEQLGTTQQQVARWETGQRDPKTSIIVRISAALGVTVSYLLGLDSERGFVPADSSPGSSVDVPVLSRVAAGAPVEPDERDASFPVPAGLARRYPRAFLLAVGDGSMSRVLPDGCLVLIDPDQREPVVDGRVYAVCVNGYDATVKRVRRLAHGWELAPDSLDPTYRPRVYDYNEPGTETVTVVGRAVWYAVPADWEI